jgi:nitroreductase
VETFLTIASKRDTRDYSAAPIPLEVRDRILDAGRLSGSSKNRQKWEFVVVSGAGQERLAAAVYAPENVRTAMLVVAIVGDAGGFDVGRCAQNMVLAAWAEGVASCPNGVRDPEAAAAICGGEVKAVISFGYPAKERRERSAEEWSACANRKPLVELVRVVGDLEG